MLNTHSTVTSDQAAYKNPRPPFSYAPRDRNGKSAAQEANTAKLEAMVWT